MTKQAELLLLQTPLLTPTLITRGSPEEATLAMRVEDLFSFRRTGLSATVQLLGYQAKEGIWVVALVFCLSGFPTGPFEGVVYLNPRKALTMPFLLLLATQERLPLVFFSPLLRVMVSHQAPWSVHQRQEVRLLLSQVQQSSVSQPVGMRDDDSEFDRARQEFEQAAARGNILLCSSQVGNGPASLTYGVVLE